MRTPVLQQFRTAILEELEAVLKHYRNILDEMDALQQVTEGREAERADEFYAEVTYPNGPVKVLPARKAVGKVRLKVKTGSVIGQVRAAIAHRRVSGFVAAEIIRSTGLRPTQVTSALNALKHSGEIKVQRRVERAKGPAIFLYERVEGAPQPPPEKKPALAKGRGPTFRVREAIRRLHGSFTATQLRKATGLTGPQVSGSLLLLKKNGEIKVVDTTGGTAFYRYEKMEREEKPKSEGPTASERVLSHLQNHGPASYSEVAKALNIPLATASATLTALRQVGKLDHDKSSRPARYSLRTEEAPTASVPA